MFTSTLKIEQVSEDEWILLSDLEFQAGNELTFVVPKGFKTDLASVPWWGRSIVPRYGRYTKSAVLHDYLLKLHPDNREFADTWLVRAMKTENTRTWRRKLIGFFTKLWSKIKSL